MKTGSARQCPVTGQEAMGTIQKTQSGPKKTAFYWVGDCALAQIAQRGCGASTCEDTQHPDQHSPGQAALGDSAWGGLDHVEIRLSGLSLSVTLCSANLSRSPGSSTPFSSWWHQQSTHERRKVIMKFLISHGSTSTHSVRTARRPQTACRGYTLHRQSSEGGV